MRIFSFTIFALILGSASASHADTLMCPTQVTIDQIKEIKIKGHIDLTTTVHKNGKYETITMSFTPGKGVDDIHTKLPISSKKFEASKVLSEAKQEGDHLTCTYKYDKTFGRNGEFQLHTKKD